MYSRTLWAITWRKFKEQWLPGLVTGIIFLLLGAWLAWKISYNDTQTQIAGLERANDQLTKTNDQLKGTNDQLKEIALGLLAERTAIVTQANQLAALVKNEAAVQRHDLRLALDKQGNVTLAGRAIVNTQGNAILTDSSWKPITADSEITVDNPQFRADGGQLLMPNGAPIVLPGGQTLRIDTPKKP